MRAGGGLWCILERLLSIRQLLLLLLLLLPLQHSVRALLLTPSRSELCVLVGLGCLSSMAGVGWWCMC